MTENLARNPNATTPRRCSTANVTRTTATTHMLDRQRVAQKSSQLINPIHTECRFPTVHQTIAKSEVPERLRLQVDIHRSGPRPPPGCIPRVDPRPVNSLRISRGNSRITRITKSRKKVRHGIELPRDMLMDGALAARLGDVDGQFSCHRIAPRRSRPRPAQSFQGRP